MADVNILKELVGKTIKSISFDRNNENEPTGAVVIQCTDNSDYEISTELNTQIDIALTVEKITKEDGLHASDAIDSTTDSDWFWEDKDKDVSQYMDVSFIKIEITNYARNSNLDPNKNADWIKLQNYASNVLEDLYNECIWNVWGAHQKDKCENILMDILKFKFESVPENLEEINDFVYDYIVDGFEPITWGEADIRHALSIYVKVQ